MTLIEILIVVILLGILAAIVIPSFGDSRGETERATFATSLKTLARACELYKYKNGDYPADGSSGTIPAGLDDYVLKSSFEGGTPIGGVWDTEFNDSSVGAAVGVHFHHDTPKDDAYMTEVDKLLDDGNLGTGAFRKIAGDRFYYILEE
jgi:type II secretory pathway pseudopilin PulG